LSPTEHFIYYLLYRFLIQAESKIQKVIKPGTETEDEEIEEIISPVVISGGNYNLR